MSTQPTSTETRPRQDKLVINLAPTGMIPTKAMTSFVPITPEEIAGSVKKCMVFGVSMVHIHARDDSGAPTHSKDIYADIISRIRDINADLIICVSTSGRSWSEFDKRSEVLELSGDVKPDMASLTLSSLNFNKQTSVNEPVTIRDLAKKMLDYGIKPELEVFDTGMLNYAKYLITKDLLRPPYYFNLILGNIACAQATPSSLGHHLCQLPPHSIWSVGGVGDYQLTANVLGMVSGGGVRVGLEDNIWYTRARRKLAKNWELVARLWRIAGDMELEIAAPEEVRWMLQL